MTPGDAVILRGPNGAGKTTLLRAVAGLLRLDAGEIRFETRSGAAYSEVEQARIYCGPLNAAKSALTVDENLRFWAALYGAPATLISRARAAFGLERFADRRVGALSTGLCRRLGLSRLLLADRPIWLIDEPTASLDAQSVETFCALVQRHRSVGGAAIIATHESLHLPESRTMELCAQRLRP